MNTWNKMTQKSDFVSRIILVTLFLGGGVLHQYVEVSLARDWGQARNWTHATAAAQAEALTTMDA